MDDQRKKQLTQDLAVSGLTVALASVLLPAVLPNEISLSPLVVFGIIFMTNTLFSMMPDEESKTEAAMFGRLFFARLAVAVLFAVLLISIETFARKL